MWKTLCSVIVVSGTFWLTACSGGETCTVCGNYFLDGKESNPAFALHENGTFGMLAPGGNELSNGEYIVSGDTLKLIHQISSGTTKQEIASISDGVISYQGGVFKKSEKQN